MARRYTSTTVSDAVLNITSLQQLKDYQRAQMEIWLAVDSGNNEAEVIRLLNALPTLATLFKGTLGIPALISTLGGYAEEAAETRKSEFLTELNDGYQFFKTQVQQWDSNFVSMKLSVPMVRVTDTQAGGYVQAIRGKGYVISKTNSQGITITF
ncbi:hypothetical protein ACOQFO_05915 [Ureibacillus sp. MALMAid1270]|uniref:hypothetical protein n=1 Tax=Ureibacillus sp. MALMAid1270 TaxID=3411629 RepID=UPI003BA5147B